MRLKWTFSRTPNAIGRSTWALAAIMLQALIGSPVSADQHYPDTTSPSQHPDSEDATTPADHQVIPLESAVPQKENKPVRETKTDPLSERYQVEAVMGRRMRREYDHYSSMSQYDPNRPLGFARYLEDYYRAKRMSGIILAAVVAPILASVTVMAAYQFYRHGVEDGGGFCNHVVYDERRDEYNTDCEGDRGEVSGIILFSTIGGLATLGVLIPGLTRVTKYSERLRRLRPLTAQSRSQLLKKRFAYALSPREIAVGFHF